MKKWILINSILYILLNATASNATIYKCEKKGKISYSETPCVKDSHELKKINEDLRKQEQSSISTKSNQTNSQYNTKKRASIQSKPHNSSKSKNTQKHKLYNVAQEMVKPGFNPNKPTGIVKEWYDHVEKVKTKLNKTMPYAIQNGDLKQVKILLSQGVDIHKEDKRGRNSLIAAARYGQYDIMKLFIEHGAKVNYRNKFGHTSLSQAIKKNHINIVELLLKNGADPNIHGRSDVPIIITAIDNNNAAIVKLLLNAGTDPNLIHKIENGPTYNPVIRAAGGKNDDIEILKLLLGAGGKADIIAGKRTVLHYGTLDGKHNNKIKYLLENGANPNAMGYYGSPAAFSKGIYHTETLSILLEHGFDPNSKDKNGLNALMRISKGINMSDKIKLLLNAGTNIKYRTPEGLNVFDIINKQIKQAKSKSTPNSMNRIMILEEQKTLINSYM